MPLSKWLHKTGGKLTLNTTEPNGIHGYHVRSNLDNLEVRIFDFCGAHAAIAAALRETARPLGLSLGDRACLALGIFEQAMVLTADRIWAKSAVSIIVRVI